MSNEASQIKAVNRAFSILAALSITISSSPGAFALDASRTLDADHVLLARFPFRKAKDDDTDKDDKSAKKAKSNSDSDKKDKKTESDKQDDETAKPDSDSEDSSGASSKANTQTDSSGANSKSNTQADSNGANSKADTQSDSGSADSKGSADKSDSNAESAKSKSTKSESTNSDSTKSEASKSNAPKQSENKIKTKSKADKKANQANKPDKKAKEEKSKDEKQKDEKQKDEKQKDEKQKDEKQKEEKQKEEKAKEEREKEDKANQEKKREQQAKEDKANEEKKREQQAKDDKKKSELEQSKKQKQPKQVVPEKAKPGPNKAKQGQKHVPRFAPPSTTSSTTATPAIPTSSSYQADSALLSLLNDLARALKDPAEQSKCGDNNQKMVVSMASDVLTKALEAHKNANRIVDKQSSGGASMNAEAWSSGDVKVSDQCRGSLAAVWAKRENGLLNVTIAGSCHDKTAPNGKKVGEYVVVLSARSAVQKGFDIQSQSDVNFWLAKLSQVSVDADCCAAADAVGSGASSVSGTESGIQSNSNAEEKELQQHALVILQTVVTERQRNFISTAYSALPANAFMSNATDQRDVLASATAQPMDNLSVQSSFTGAENVANGKAAKDRDESGRKAANDREESGRKAAKDEEGSVRAASKEREEAQRKAVKDKEEADRKASKEREEAHRKAAKDKEEADRKAEKEQEARQKIADKEREKEDERLASEDQKRLRDKEKLAAKAIKDKSDEVNARTQQDDFSSRDSYSAKMNARQTNREDMILEEATRQAEAERVSGLDSRASYPSERMTRENKMLAEATQQAEDERREAADMRAPHDAEKMTRDDMILAEATRQAEAERREELLRKAEPPQQVAIGDQQASLRPVLTSSGKSAEVLSAPLVASAETNTERTGYGWEMMPSANRKPSRWAGTEADYEASADVPVTAPTQIASKSSDVAVQRLQGTKLVAPQRCIAGQYITAAVMNAKNEGQDGVELSFNGVNYTTDEHGQVAFMIPDDTAPGAAMSVAMTDYKAEKHPAIEVLQPLSTSAEESTPAIEKISHIVSSNGTLILDGHNFDGIAHRNRVTIDEYTDGEVLAASPVQLKVAVPADLKPGKHKALLDIGLSKSNTAEFELLATEVVSDPREPNTKLIIRVLGTTNKTSVHVLNKTPEVIKISKGNDLQGTTTGGDNNTLVLLMQRLRKGSYRVTATVN